MTARAAAQPALFDTPTPTTPEPPRIPANTLRDHLIATGHLTETGLTRAARIHTCPRCQQPTLSALDDDTAALEAHTDPTPLNPLGEALALLENRHTYALHRERGRWTLDHRDRDHITGRPAGTRPREDVLTTHRCHAPVPPAWTAPSSFPETRPRPAADAAPPF